MVFSLNKANIYMANVFVNENINLKKKSQKVSIFNSLQ